MGLPDQIYVMWFEDHHKKKRSYYSKKNRRFYAQANHVMQYLNANKNLEHPVIYLIEPGQDWKDVTLEFLNRRK